MPSATLTLPAATDQARTARLVAAAAARRARLSDDCVDDVRLAVSEAVARAVLRSLADDDPATDTITITLTDTGSQFEITVIDAAADPGRQPAAEATGEPIETAADATDDEHLALSVMQALAPDSRVAARPQGGREIVLSWPLAT